MQCLYQILGISSRSEKYCYRVEQSKWAASIQILKIASTCNWQLFSYSTWCRHKHDAQISALAVADNFLPEENGTSKYSVLFLSAGTFLSVPTAVAHSLGPLTPNNTEQTVRDFTPKAPAVPLQHFWAVLEKSLAGPAFCFLSLSFTWAALTTEDEDQV